MYTCLHGILSLQLPWKVMPTTVQLQILLVTLLLLATRMCFLGGKSRLPLGWNHGDAWAVVEETSRGRHGRKALDGMQLVVDEARGDLVQG
uniref:Uncharacterized protein n=1 Tax=Arundo donax TaxID=35708 RepID=A0A0A9DBQ2_ARUDO